jgi:hypothetical protein
MTTITPDPVLDPLRRELGIQAVRHAAGRAIFCPGHLHAVDTAPVLDARRAVVVGTTVVCAACWQALSDDQRAFLFARVPAEDILDGPALHGLEPVVIRPEPRTEVDGQMALL